MSEKSLRERKTVYDELTSDTNRPPLTLEELRQRLKHIAGLCWGLSIDIHNEIERNNELTAENKRLQDEIKGLNDELKLLRWRQRSRDQAKLKARATIEAEQNAGKPTVHTPKPAKTNTKKQLTDEARAKRNAAFEALPPKERERRLKKREYQKQYVERERAKQLAQAKQLTQGGSDESNEN